MPRFITALFENREEAEQAIAELHAGGFQSNDVQHIDREREREGFFERLFLNEDGGVDEDVSLLGIARARVEQYARLVRSGLSLVIVMCGDTQVQEVRDIFRNYDVVDVGSLREGVSQPIDQGDSTAEQDWPPKWFEVVEVEETDRLRRGARSHAVHMRPKRGIHHQSTEDMPGAHRSRRFDEFETDFRVHYAENFSDSRYSFEDFELAYRYGMRLAEAVPLFDQPWSSIEEVARRGWVSNTDRPWEGFGEAVHFGWKRVTHARESEEEFGRKGRWTH